MLRDTQSRYFDSVYFVLRSELPQGARESDMLRAARKLIEPDDAEHKAVEHRVRRIDGMIAYLSGAATVGLIAGALSLAAHLLC